LLPGTSTSRTPTACPYLDLATNATRLRPARLDQRYLEPGISCSDLDLSSPCSIPNAAAEFPLLHLINVLQFPVCSLRVSLFFTARGQQNLKPRPGSAEAFVQNLFLWSFPLVHLATGGNRRKCARSWCLWNLSILPRACVARPLNNPRSLKHWVQLGAVLGIGYYVQISVVPLGTRFDLHLYPFQRRSPSAPNEIPSPPLPLCHWCVFFLTVSPLMSGSIDSLPSAFDRRHRIVQLHLVR